MRNTNLFSCCVNRERLGRCCIDLTSLVLNPLCRIEEVQNIICNVKSATSTCAVLNITRWYHRRFCLYTHKKSTSCSWYPVSAHAGLVTHVLCVCHLNNMYAARRSQPGRNNLPQVLWITLAWRARERAHLCANSRLLLPRSKTCHWRTRVDKRVHVCTNNTRTLCDES